MKLQLAYHIYQDRLLLLVEPDDAQAKGFWLTRRMTALLWKALTDQLASSVAPGASADAQNWLLCMQHEEAVGQHSPVAEQCLAPCSEPVLASTLQYGRHEDGRMIIGLRDSEGQGDNYALADEFVHALLAMIQQEVEQADWGLYLAWPIEKTAWQPQPTMLQ